MKKDKSNNFMAIINKVPPIISFISLIIGICLTLITIPKACSEKGKLDREAWESQPKFEAYFLDMPFNMYFQLIKDKSLFKLGSENYPIWKYPISKNDISELAESLSEAEERSQRQEIQKKDDSKVEKYDSDIIEIKKPQTYNKYFITLLVIEQKGKRKAEEVLLDIDQAISKEGLDIYTADDLAREDYLKKIKEQSTLKNRQIMLGSLDTGQGVMVPLSIRKAVKMSDTTIYIKSEGKFETFPGGVTVRTMGNVYFPKKIIFKDSYDHKIKEYEIRKMLDIPIILSPDIEIRG